jgi:hypothetical protein
VINRDYLGHVSEPTSTCVEIGQLKLFNKAIGEVDAVYQDEAAARAAGYRSILAPPTFGTCLNELAPRTLPSYEELGLDYERLLHGEESYIYHQQICAGDTITLQTRISEIYEKKNGALEFIVMDTTLTNQLDELVQELRTVLLMPNC